MGAADYSHLNWRISSRSGGSNCVEIAFTSESVLLRDSKDPDGPILTLTRSEWTALIDDLTSGRLNKSSQYGSPT